ncbi:MAG: hypothetical protein ACXVKO_08525 [Bacteriovorax sp.]
MKLVFLFALLLPLNAANTDDEIIKDLDFFQNLELIKKENPFALMASDQKNSDKEKTKAVNKTLIGKKK